MKNLKFTITLLLALAIAPIACGQSAITKVVNRLENDPKTEYSVYSEKRDPTTREVVESTKVLILKDNSQLKSIENAFNKERPNATEVEISSGPNKVYTLRFVDTKVHRMQAYTLLYKQGKPQILVVEVVPLPRMARPVRTCEPAGPIGENTTVWFVL